MPASLVERLPLPNLKVYSALSVALLSSSVYYAASVTSSPEWRANNTRVEAGPAEAAPGPPPPDLPLPLDTAPRDLHEQLLDVMLFMMQDPFCIWTLINTAYWFVCVGGAVVVHAAFGSLRAAESRRARDLLCNFVFYKFIFVFGVLSVQWVAEVLLWAAWFTALGAMHVLAQLAKDRLEYLSFSPTGGSWRRARLLALLGGVASAALGLLYVAMTSRASWHTAAFCAAECLLVLLAALAPASRAALQAMHASPASPLAYYTQLFFDTAPLATEAAHVLHQAAWSQAGAACCALVLLLQLRALLLQLRRRLQRHRHYRAVTTHMDLSRLLQLQALLLELPHRLHHHRLQRAATRPMERSYPLATPEQLAAHSDHCAICWESMSEARRLPCDHLFHNGCLTLWLQQDASCPTCRRALPPARPARPARPPAPPAQPPTLFHFDGSRYVSWLPVVSVEVTRARLQLQRASQVDAMAAQVQAMFPQYSLAALGGDLAVTRSVELTVENILEGRLPPPRRAPSPPTDPPATLSTVESAAPAPAATPAVASDTDKDSADDLLDNDSTQDEPVSQEFSTSSGERAAGLARRRALLLARARRRYLARAAPSLSAAPAPPPPPPPQH